MKLHFSGWAKDLNIADLLSESNSYNLPFSFGFDEEQEDTIKNVFLKIYTTETECSLSEAERGHLANLFGDFSAIGQLVGSSEYTIEGFTVEEGTVMLGGHDVQKIINGNIGKYLHIIIEEIADRRK